MDAVMNDRAATSTETPRSRPRRWLWVAILAPTVLFLLMRAVDVAGGYFTGATRLDLVALAARTACAGVLAVTLAMILLSVIVGFTRDRWVAWNAAPLLALGLLWLVVSAPLPGRADGFAIAVRQLPDASEFQRLAARLRTLPRIDLFRSAYDEEHDAIVRAFAETAPGLAALGRMPHTVTVDERVVKLVYGNSANVRYGLLITTSDACPDPLVHAACVRAMDRVWVYHDEP